MTNESFKSQYSKQITVYTTRYCPHCTRAKAFLKDKKIPFREIDVTEDDAKRQEVEKRTGWMTVPMIFIGDELIGGADELFALERSGQLEAKLKKLKGSDPFDPKGV